jgi:hypothetical protein
MARAFTWSSHGLNASFYDGVSTASSPAPDRTMSGAPISVRGMTVAWNGALPQRFRVRWSGFLRIDRAGRYRFATVSDDGSFVRVGDRLVVDNGGVHGAEMREGQIDLPSGAHPVEIEYVQEGGEAAMEWLWAPGGGSLHPVPWHVLSPAVLSDRQVRLERRLDQLLAGTLTLVIAVGLWVAFAHAGAAMATTSAILDQGTPLALPRASAYLRLSSFALLAVGAGLVAAASVPAFRSPWSLTQPATEVTGALFVTEPIRSFTTPYISFASIRFSDPPPVATSRLRLVVASNGAAIASRDELRARTLFAVDVPASAASDAADYELRLPRARQFGPSETIRVALVVETDSSSTDAIRPAAVNVTIGYDGTSPAVAVIHYWWPWIAGLAVTGAVCLFSPTGRFLQVRSAAWVHFAIRDHRRLLLLIGVSMLIRLVLVRRGGQYFDWDELRYGDGATRMFELLSTGNVRPAVDRLFASPDHPGFRLVGLALAFFQVVSAWPTAHAISDTLRPSGEWLAAFLLSLSSVCSIGLTYLIARRANSSREEALLAACLLASSASMLIHTRHFFPYDAAMAMLLFGIWVGIKPDDHPARSYIVGIICGCGFLVYEGYWLLAAVAGLLHVLHRPFNIGVAFWRGALSAAGLITPIGLLLTLGWLADHSILYGLIRFSATVVNGDFAEGWSLPWAFFWSVDRALLVIYAVGIAAAAWYAREPGSVGHLRGIIWLLAAGSIYAGLVVGSNALHLFTVYDRLARQMVPFLCLASAVGWHRLTNGGHRRGLALVPYVAAGALFGLNSLPLIAQRYPRDIVIQVTNAYGAADVRLDRTVMTSDEVSARARVMFEGGASAGARYVLVNAGDIWFGTGRQRWLPPPKGRVLLLAAHPRQLRSLQYHGYTPEDRAFLRRVDASIQLIDTRPEGP